MGTRTSEQHVVVVQLVVNARQASIIDGRLRARGKLRNATLGTLLARVEGMRRDPRWRAARALKDAAARSKALGALRYEFGLTSAGAYRVAFDHWQASGWMPTVIDSRVSNAVAQQVWTEVKNWLLGHTRPPGFQPSAEEDVCWGNGNRAGLRLKDVRVHWPCQTKRKTLNVELARDWRPGTRKWGLHLDGREVARVGVKREEVRGRARYFALICVTGAPYRNPEYLATTREGVVGLDVGPSLLAVVGENASVLLNRAPKELLKARKAQAARIRRAQRALDRSRRAMNPDCYDERGRSIRGKRPVNESARYKRKQARLRHRARSERINRERDAVVVARGVMAMGTTPASESNSYRSWQASRYGRRMGFTAPGALMSRIARERVLLADATSSFRPRRHARPASTACAGASSKSRCRSAPTSATSAAWARTCAWTATCSVPILPGSLERRVAST